MPLGLFLVTDKWTFQCRPVRVGDGSGLCCFSSAVEADGGVRRAPCPPQVQVGPRDWPGDSARPGEGPAVRPQAQHWWRWGPL